MAVKNKKTGSRKPSYKKPGSKRDSAAALLDALGLSPQEGPSRARANDYFSNSAARMGWGTPSLTEATEYDLVRLSFNYPLMYTLYRNHWIARRVVDVPAQDMVRAWPRLTSELKPKDLTKIDRAIRDNLVKSQILLALQWSRLFGGAGALMAIDGHDHQLDEPLDIESVGIGAFKGLIPFDMWSGIHPGPVIGADITKPREFNLPTHYQVNVPNGSDSFQVHSSRILRFCGPPVPTPEYQAEMYWGISVLEVIYEELRKRDNLSWNILSLTFRANLIGIEFDQLAQALSGAGMNQSALQQFYERMEGLNQLMSNQSLIVLPKDSKLQGLMYPFTGLADVLQQFQLDIAGAAEIPVTKLFGRTLTGLGQSNDADIEMYEQKISMEQTVNLLPQLDALYRVICMSELGVVPGDLDLAFPSVRVLDEKQKSDLGKTTGDTITGYFNAGLMTRPQAMKEIKQTSDFTGIGTNLTEEDIAQAEKDDEMAAEMGLEAGEKDEPKDGTSGPEAKDSIQGLLSI